MKTLRASGRLFAWTEISADVETPVSAYLKIRRGPHGFLFESVEGGERQGRYSFLGSGPAALLTARGAVLEEVRDGRTSRLAGNPLELLARRLGKLPAGIAGLPRFAGGLVGFAGYDAVRYVEALPRPPKDDRGLPDLSFMLYETVLIFDRVRHTITILTSVEQKRKDGRTEVARRLAEMEARLARPLTGAAPQPVDTANLRLPKFTSNMSRATFIRNVHRAKRSIKVGDIIQVVLSQRLAAPFTGDPLVLYRAQRVLNPSPYMFFLECGDVTLVGSSPEMLIRVDGGEAETRPIAGTRPRGRNAAEDQRLEKELLADPKERAEHVMLVDLGRNDLGRVCEYGSVRVTDNMVVERYSHVMHIVSGVKGRLAPGKTAFDALRAAFPAGTVSGAPKVRAMQIIDALEPTRRGPYAGAAGYVSFNGNMDTAIAIRTIVVSRGTAWVQAGMGIVADSVPAAEYQESMNKARAALLAIAAANGGRT